MLKKVVLVAIVGIVSLVVDELFDVPSPPAWLFAWSRWLLTGLALLFGPSLANEALAAWRSGRAEREPGVDG